MKIVCTTGDENVTKSVKDYIEMRLSFLNLIVVVSKTASVKENHFKKEVEGDPRVDNSP